MGSRVFAHPVRQQGIESGGNCGGKDGAKWDRMWSGRSVTPTWPWGWARPETRHTRAVQADRTGAMWQGFGNSGRAKIGGVPAARSSHYIGHELGVSGGEYIGIKHGMVSGGSVP